jgi:hypothetical protein
LGASLFPHNRNRPPQTLLALTDMEVSPCMQYLARSGPVKQVSVSAAADWAWAPPLHPVQPPPAARGPVTPLPGPPWPACDASPQGPGQPTGTDWLHLPDGPWVTDSQFADVLVSEVGWGHWGGLGCVIRCTELAPTSACACGTAQVILPGVCKWPLHRVTLAASEYFQGVFAFQALAESRRGAGARSSVAGGTPSPSPPPPPPPCGHSMMGE